jgi:uncharacterized delta-60 repeat protein
MTRLSHRRSFVVSAASLAAVALALTLGVSGAQAAAGGTAWWDYWPANGGANAVALQPDGKIVATGIGEPSLNAHDFMLARYGADGVPDSNFGKNGKVLTDFGGSESANALAIQSDGKIVVVGYSNASGSYDFALARYTTNGTLDTSFGTGGKVLTDFGSGSTDLATALAIQPNGEIVVAGYSLAKDRTDDFALARYTASGTLDASFGTGGEVLTSFGSSASGRAEAVAIQRNGEIVLAGGTSGPKLNKFALARYTTSGTLDKSFGTGGEVLTGFRSSNHSSADGIAIQKNGKIVAVGSTRHAGVTHFALARYTARGLLDPRFGTGGRVLTRFGSSSQSQALAVAIQADGKIVAAGYGTYVVKFPEFDCSGDRDSIALARYTTRGVLDTSFGKGGKVAEHLGSYAYRREACASERAEAVAVKPNGSIVTAGYFSAGDGYFLLARYFGH